ncbi:hypothetical protein KASHIRA_00550 [Serratia phage vB_SmaM-Kashira]|nr:hypothetical protein KASHIRA_00550 [Serratia phage vB_SmaM-Kashira]
MEKALAFTRDSSSLKWYDYLRFRLADGGIKGITLSEVDCMTTEEFLQACEYVDMKDHIIEAGDKDRKVEETSKPPRR